MAPTATVPKVRWAPQARHKLCMGWSWAAEYRVGDISWRPPAYNLLDVKCTSVQPLLQRKPTVTWKK